jgi:Na+-translocating ferredoxin:NAD+ oxidoreductase RnfD subunit
MMNQTNWDGTRRLAGLRRFALGLTTLNILGHTVFGFEQSWAQPLVGIGAAYAVELLLEFVDSRAKGRRPNYAGGPLKKVDFLLSAHISGLATSMLLYANDRLWVIAFAAAVAVGSKAIFRVPVGSRSRHIFNPSNFGITVTLLLFSWVGIAPPYQFTENIFGAGDWILPAAIIATGTFLNFKFTRKLPLIGTWVTCFALQGVLRSIVLGGPLLAPLMPMTGVAFIIFTVYMITDPATTPSSVGGQILFGASVAAVYGLLIAAHVVFGLFFSLTIVATIRGVAMYADYFTTVSEGAAESKVKVTAAASEA